MVYTPEEKKKMDNVLDVFAEYTAKHPDFDIAYSDKTGYVKLIIAQYAEAYFFPISGFEKLLDIFCLEFVSEQIRQQVGTNLHMRNCDVDYDIIRIGLQRYIDRLDIAYREQATKFIDAYIAERISSPYLV